jgi:hypothetical protein
MSVLINEAYANATTPLWASVGGGGGNYVPITPVNIPAYDTLTYNTPLEFGVSQNIWAEAITLPDGLWQFNIDVLTTGTLAGASVGYFTLFALYVNDDGGQYSSVIRDFSIQVASTQVYNLRLQIPIVDAVAKNGAFTLVLNNSTGVDMNAGWERIIANYSKILLTNDFTYVPPPP